MAKNAGQVVVVELELMVIVSNKVGFLTVPTLAPVSVAAESEDALELAVEEESTGVATAEPGMKRTRRMNDKIVNLALNE